MIKNFQQNLFAICLVFLSLNAAAQDDVIPSHDSSSNQELTLFEGIEATESRPSTPSRPTQESRATLSEPVFTLVGTSRIGKHHSAILRHQNGESISVGTVAGSTSPIAGYEEFTVFDVGAGALSVRYPSDIPCVGFKDKGVSCSAAPNTALLQLVNAQAIARAVPVPNADQSAGLVSSNAEPGASDQVANPFEALRAARANGNPDQSNVGDRNSRFTPRRISPEDVPPGMRVVSTPFGDRLVEQ